MHGGKHHADLVNDLIHRRQGRREHSANIGSSNFPLLSFSNGFLRKSSRRTYKSSTAISRSWKQSARPGVRQPASPVNNSVPPSGRSDGDAAGASGQGRVGGEIGEELTGAGGVDDDVLDAGVEAIQVKDVAGGGGVSEPVTDGLDPVGGGRDGEAVRVGGQVEIAKRDQADWVHERSPADEGWGGGRAPLPEGRGAL